MTARTLLVLVSALASAGCEEEEASAAGPPGEFAYANGHPVTVAFGDPAARSVEENLARLANEHRAGKGLPPLLHEESLREVARAHALHMIVHDFFAHVNPEGDGPGRRLTLAGEPWSRSGENLAVGYATAQEAFDAWLASPTHRATLEDPDWTHFGSGFWQDPADGGSVVYERYYVQDFLRRPM